MNRKARFMIIALSLFVPLLIAFLIFRPGKPETLNEWFYYLPHVNGIINSITSGVLIFGYIMISNGYKKWHKMAMITSFFLGFLFLISYITYHSMASTQLYGDINHNGMLDPHELLAVQFLRVVYLSLLLVHILLAVLAVPLIFTAFYYALTGKFEKHRKIVKFAFPVWLTVSVTGVVVYLMVSPYY